MIRRYSRIGLVTIVMSLLITMMIVVSKPALAGTDDYPISISGCHYASNPGGSAFTCNLKNAASNTLIDPWKEYNRECTSFVAWRLHSRNRFEMPFNDVASGWKADASGRGYVVNMTPALGAVAWFYDTVNYPSGHVAWVESVSSGNVTIEEYNFLNTHNWHERTIAANSVSGYIHFKDLGSSSPPPAPTPTPTPQITRPHVTVSGAPAPNQWYTDDASLGWQVTSGSCGSYQLWKSWDNPVPNRGAATTYNGPSNGWQHFGDLGNPWPTGWHTFYLVWWDCDGYSETVTLGPYGAAPPPAPVGTLPAMGSTAYDVPISGAFWGDGISYIGIIRGTYWILAQSNSNPNGGYVTVQFGAPGDIPIIGKWWGGSTAYIGVFRPSSNQWILAQSNTNPGANAVAVQFGANGDQPVVGDWNNSGSDYIGIYRPNVQTWVLALSNANPNSSTQQSQFGAVGDIPVVGRWWGGPSLIGIFRPGSNYWVLAQQNNNANANAVAIQFGATGDVPIVGDWTGNGKTLIGIRRSDTQFILAQDNSNANGTAFAAVYGASGDQLVLGKWQSAAGADFLGLVRNHSYWFLANSNTSPGGGAINVPFGCSQPC